MVYRAKKDMAAAGPDPELLALPGLSGQRPRSAGSDDDLGGRATGSPVWYGRAGFLSADGRLAAAHSSGGRPGGGGTPAELSVSW